MWKTEALVVSTKEVGVEAKVENIYEVYMHVSHEQTARKHHNIMTDNKSLKNMATF